MPREEAAHVLLQLLSSFHCEPNGDDDELVVGTAGDDERGNPH